MYDAELSSTTAAAPRADLDAAVARAAEALRRWQKPDGHWVFELEADATIPAEHLLLRRYLGEPHDPDLERRTANYLHRIQGGHGGWPLFHEGAFDISATVKAYFALRHAGDAPDAPHMVRAREAVLAHGGAAAVNVFTRIQLALFGIAPPGRKPWSDVPTMPPELILVPRWFPIHLGKMSYWARTVIAPLLVLGALRPVARDTSVRLDELYLPLGSKLPTKKTHQKPFWRAAFGALDVVLKAVEPFWPKRLRDRAVERCRTWVVERLNGEDGLGAIYPAMANSVMMFDALGYSPEHPDRAIARKSVADLVVHAPEDGHPDEIYCQPCVSPVWDTALAAHAMMEAGDAASETAALEALAWLKPLQVLDVKGDWAEVKPDVRPGGWAFQYRNDHYPDLDDTAVVVMAMDRARSRLGAQGYDEAISRGDEWTVGLQSRNGGFGAFDADNSHHYLNNIPFADHGALLDPPTEDVTGRVVSMMAQLGEPADSPRLRAACRYLEETQAPDGSWFGRWGVNYIYGTWSVMCALHAAGYAGDHPAMKRGANWLLAIQNADDGWGEDCESYALDYAGYAPHPSVASQTAWALLALMAAGLADHPAVARGIAWLLERQGEDGLWPQEHYTGGGFPRVFYLRYHGYPKFFPLWAVARYRNLVRANSREVAWGDVTLLIVTGLLSEAEIAAGEGVVTLAAGGDAALDRRLEQAIATLRPAAILSFGVAGALHPSLAVGDGVVGVEVKGDGWSAPCDAAWAAALASACRARTAVVTALSVPATTVEMKRVLGRLGAATTDMESHAAALAAREAGLPFAVLRVVSDTADQAIPPAALAGMREDGGTDALAVVGALVRAPWQLPALLRTARDFGRALRRLRELRAAAGPRFSLPS